MSIFKVRKKLNTDISQVMADFLGKPFKWIALAITFLAVIIPFYWLFTNAFKYEQEYLASPPVLIPTKITIENFIKIFAKDDVMKGLYNSLTIGLTTVLITVFFGSLAAYTLIRGKISQKVKILFLYWFIIQKMYPAICTAIPIFIVMRNLGLIDTKIALIIMNSSFNLPLVIWIMIGFFQGLPSEIIEASKIDGCNMWQSFYRIVLPITKTGLVAAAILTFVATWNEFLFAVILSINRAKTLPVIIAGFITDKGLAWGPMAALGTVIIVPVMIIVWALQKDFVKGLSMGAIK